MSQLADQIIISNSHILEKLRALTGSRKHRNYGIFLQFATCFDIYNFGFVFSLQLVCYHIHNFPSFLNLKISGVK